MGKKKIYGFILLGFAFFMITGYLVFKGSVSKAATNTNGDLQIVKSEVTSKAKFYPYTADGVKMEIIAVKASDGTVRTAFNTCQVCNNSGRGYYVQERDQLVCQNCGNRFQIDMVEKLKNGCNPVPITPEFKKEDAKTITISKSLLTQAKVLFKYWKNR